jgi:hypothetical protein
MLAQLTKNKIKRQTLGFAIVWLVYAHLEYVASVRNYYAIEAIHEATCADFRSVSATIKGPVYLFSCILHPFLLLLHVYLRVLQYEGVLYS